MGLRRIVLHRDQKIRVCHSFILYLMATRRHNLGTPAREGGLTPGMMNEECRMMNEE